MIERLKFQTRSGSESEIANLLGKMGTSMLRFGLEPDTNTGLFIWRNDFDPRLISKTMSFSETTKYGICLPTKGRLIKFDNAIIADFYPELIGKMAIRSQFEKAKGNGVSLLLTGL